jgi:hypothetical protein
MAERRVNRLLDWLDSRSGWQFVTILYVARWLVLVPVSAVTDLIFSDADLAAASIPDEWKNGTAIGLFFGLVVVPPLLETLLVCSLPYWIVAWVRGYRHTRPHRCWGFVAISACGMVALHPIPAAVSATVVTGVFLAYCYAHFAATSTLKAISATWIFHGGINMVGWAMLMIT